MTEETMTVDVDQPISKMAGRLFKKTLIISLDTLFQQSQQIKEGGLDEAIRIVLQEEVWQIEDKITRLDLVALLEEAEALEEVQLWDIDGHLKAGEYEELVGEEPITENIKSYVGALYIQLSALREAMMALNPIQRLMEVSEGGAVISNSWLAEVMQKARLKDVNLDLDREAVSETAGEGLGPLDGVLAQVEDFVRKEAEKREKFFETRERVFKAFKQRRPKGQTRREEEEDEGVQKIVDDLADNVEEFERMKASLPEHIRTQIEEILRDKEKVAPLRRELKNLGEKAKRSWLALRQKLAMSGHTPEETVRWSQNEISRYLALLDQGSKARQALEEAQHSPAETAGTPEFKPEEKKELPRINNILWVELQRVKENNVIAGIVREEISGLISSQKEKDWDTAMVLGNLLERINKGKIRHALKEVEDLIANRKIPQEVYSSIILKAGKRLSVSN